MEISDNLNPHATRCGQKTGLHLVAFFNKRTNREELHLFHTDSHGRMHGPIAIHLHRPTEKQANGEGKVIIVQDPEIDDIVNNVRPNKSGTPAEKKKQAEKAMPTSRRIREKGKSLPRRKDQLRPILPEPAIASKP